MFHHPDLFFSPRFCVVIAPMGDRGHHSGVGCNCRGGAVDGGLCGVLLHTTKEKK